MKPGNYMVFAAILLSSISAYGDYYPDDEIKEALNYRTLPKCGNPNVRSAPRVSVTEWRYFDGDTNRLLRVMREFYADCTDFQKRILMDDFVSCGVNSLPFLYSCATNPVCGDCAIKSIIAIEGVTSNSMAVVAAFNSSTNTAPRKKIQVLEAFVDSGGRADASAFERDLSLCYALSFASSYDKYTEWMDSVICRNDQSYRNSKRRLAVLRSEFAAGLDHWEIGFVTNAINELVAYPEADLPD